jgi:hypothetical protein
VGTGQVRNQDRRAIVEGVMARRSVQWIGVVGGFGLGLVACGSSASPGADEPAAAPAVEWIELPAPPLGPRSHVVGVWSGREVFFVGGDTFMCPPGADCGAPDEPLLADGAAFDPGPGSWRAIAQAPVAFSWASTALIDDDIYFLVPGTPGRPGAERAFLRYSIGADAWQELPAPAGELGWYHLVAAAGTVVAYSNSDEGGGRPDLVYDPDSGVWAELPEDPLSPGFDRTMVWSPPHLYLFGHELVPNPGSAEPTLTRAARLDPGTGGWERLPDSEILGTGPWFVEDQIMVNPDLGGADGGEVDNWGRRYPNGGVFDTASATWSELPTAPAGANHAAGVLGARSALISSTSGWLLDLATGAWVELPALPEPTADTQRPIVTAGADAVVFGGARWDGSDGELLGDAWIWRSGRTT